MVENTNAEFEATIRTGILALVGMLGIPAVVYFGLRDPLGAETANALALGSSVVVAVAIISLLLWYEH